MYSCWAGLVWCLEAVCKWWLLTLSCPGFKSSSLLSTVAEVFCDPLWNIYFCIYSGCLLSSIRNLRGLIVAFRMHFLTSFTVRRWLVLWGQDSVPEHLGNTVLQSGSVLFGEPVLFSRAFSQEQAHGSFWDHKIAVCLWPCRKPKLSPAEYFVSPEVVCGQQMLAFTHLQGNSSSVTFLSESILPVTCQLCSEAFPVPVSLITWEQLYGNPLWSCSLGSSQTRPSFLALFWGSYSKEQFWTSLFSPPASLLPYSNTCLGKKKKVSLFPS